MAKIFRKIRQELLSKKKFSRYLLYAVGEIVLVVIGILIALAINNKNQRSIESKNEQTYLIGLQKEFEMSKLKLDELISVNQQSYQGAKQLLVYISSPEELSNEVEFSKLLYTTFASDIAFNPNNSLLHEMINSGGLKNISNTKLRIELTNWVSTLDDISKQEQELGIQRELVLNMFRTDRYNLQTILKHVGVYSELGLPKSDSTYSNLALLRAPEFENNILLFLLACHATEQAHYVPLMEDLNTILMLISEELD